MKRKPKGKKMDPNDNQNLGNDETSNAAANKKTYTAKLLKREFSFSGLQLGLFGLVFALIGSVILLSTFAASPNPQTTTASDLVPGQLMVRFKANATKAQRDNALKSNNAEVVKEIPQIGVKVIKVPESAAAAVQTALSHNPAVDFVEQDRVIKPAAQFPDDPYFAPNLALNGGNWDAYQINAPQAWDITEGSSAVNIAIVDTGIKPSTIADLTGQISSTWNVMNNTTDATTNAGSHGTYVAGAASSIINNQIGNTGICPKCKLMVVQVGTDTGATLSNIASGVTYAADHDAKVINMSWAGSSDSTTLSSATSYAHNKGAVMFAAAGNSNCDCKTFPSGDPYVLGVAGTNNTVNGTATKAGDSNFGSWVSIAAPEGYVTGWPVLNGQQGYGGVGGTSLASPVAAGVAGLMFSYNSSLTGAQVETAIESTAKQTSFSTKYGLIDALAALQALGASDPQPNVAPSQVAPASIYYTVNGLNSIAPLTSTPQVGQDLVRGYGGWTGAAPLTDSSLQWQRCDTNGANCTNLAWNNGGGTYEYVVQSSDIGYRIKELFTIKNNVGSTQGSALTGIVGGVSTPVPTVTISASPSSIAYGDGSVLSWSSTNATGCTSSGSWSGTRATSGSLTVNPSANSTYTLTCTGAGGSASASATILVAPAASPPATPSGLAPTPGDSSVTLTWNPNSETDLAGYEIQYKPTSGSTWTLLTTASITATVSGLTNGTGYDFQVRAKNTSGQTSAWSASVSATPAGSQPADTQAPSVTISSPANGSSIAGLKRVNINASATDNNVVIKMELYIDGQLKTTVTTPSLSYNWSLSRKTANGSHTITVKAYDAANNVGQASVSVTK